MAFIMEKILNDARKLANRLKEHDGSTDNLVTQMTALNKKIDSMKTFQENLPDLNELVLRKPRSAIKLGLSQENSQIRELELENKELKQSLEEHELALELIMSRYRQQVTKLLVSNQVDQSMLHKETVQAQEVQDKAEHIYEMGTVMWKAMGKDDQSIYDTQQVLAQLKVENQGMRELLQICCSSGNPLRISDRQTQTSGLPLSSPAVRNNSSTVSSALGGAYGGGSVPQESTVVSGATKNALKSLQPGERDLLSDGCARDASKVGQQNNEQADLGRLEASACMLPSNAFVCHQKPSMQASNSPSKMQSSELYSMQVLPSHEKQVPLITEAAESLLFSLYLNADKGSDVQEQQPMNPSTSKTTSCSRETLVDPATIGSPELVLENHTDKNQIPNHLETSATDDNQLDTSVNSVTVSISATQEPDSSFCASSPLSTTITASSSDTATTTESTLLQSRQFASSTPKIQTTSPKGAALPSGGKQVSIPLGGTQKNPPSSGHVTHQRNAATTSSASPSSRLKHGATSPSGTPSKAPTRSPVARDGASSSPSGTTAVKLTSSGSPSVHSAKISAAAHSSRATPIRIKTTKKMPSVAASVASPTTVSSPSTTATSSVPLDSNGNSHTSMAILNEISNINKMPNDATVDGQ